MFQFLGKRSRRWGSASATIGMVIAMSVSSASAASWDYSFDFGVLDSGRLTPDSPWSFKSNGTVYAHRMLYSTSYKSDYAESGIWRASVYGSSLGTGAGPSDPHKMSEEFGAWLPGTEERAREIYDERGLARFENTYTFTLTQTSDVTAGLLVCGWGSCGPDDRSFYYEGNDPKVEITLRDSHGNVIAGVGAFGREGPRDMESQWIREFSNLAAGEYSFTVSGIAGGFQPWAPQFPGWQEYEFYVAKAPQDVPLPGALVLLGSALVGAGAYGRRKRAGKKA